MRFTADQAFEDRSITMTRAAAEQTLNRHGFSIDDMEQEFAHREAEYVAADVLGWLGY